MSQPKGRAYDTTFELHQGLIHTLARKGFGRLMQAKVCIDYEDVFQEMCVTYVKAVDKYDSEKGITFTAYLGRAIWNEFNKFAERQVGYRANMGEGLSSLQEVKVGCDDDDRHDPLEFIVTDYENPIDRVEALREVRTNMSLLGPVSSFIVKQLMEPSDAMLKFIAERRGDMPNNNDPKDNALARAGCEVTIRTIISYHKIPAEKARNAKRQLNSIYGIGI